MRELTRARLPVELEKKREVHQALEEGREYFTVTDHKQRFRRVRFDDEKAGSLYLMMKKPDDA